MFVSGPVGTSVTGDDDRPIVSAIHGDRVRRDRLDARLWERRAVEAALSVDVSRDDELPLERVRRSGRHGDVGPAGELEHP